MGARKKHNYRCAIPMYLIPVDISNATTTLPEPIDPKSILGDKSQYSESKYGKEYEKIRRRTKIPHALKNTQERTMLTRTDRMYNKISLYNMLRDIFDDELHNNDVIYVSHLKIYKHCKNVINKEKSILIKVDDSKYLSFSRINVLKEVICYLFSLINHDTLNFDENKNSINEFVDENMSQITEWEYRLRYSLILDGLFNAINELIFEKDTDYKIEPNRNLEFGDMLYNDIKKQTSDKSSQEFRKDYKGELLNKLSLTGSFFSNYFSKVYKYNKDVSIHNFLAPSFFVNRNRAKTHRDALQTTYTEWFKKLNNWSETHEIDEFEILFCLYYINKYSHVIDMQYIGEYNKTIIPLYRLEGLFTSITIMQIIEENEKILSEYSSNYSASKFQDISYNISCPSIDENSLRKNISERDIEFLKLLIGDISDTFKHVFLSKPEKKHDSTHNYQRAVKVFEKLPKDDSIINFLKKCNFINTIQELSNKDIDMSCYREIYNDLYNATLKNDNDGNTE